MQLTVNDTQQEHSEKLRKQQEIVEAALLYLCRSALFKPDDESKGCYFATLVDNGKITSSQIYLGYKRCKKYWRELRKANPPIELPRKWVNDYRLEGNLIWNDSKGTGPYELTVIGDGELSCTCEAFEHGQTCGHVKYAQPILAPMPEPHLARIVKKEPSLPPLPSSPPVAVVTQDQSITEILPGIEGTAGQIQALKELVAFAQGINTVQLLSGHAGSGKTLLIQAWLTELCATGGRQPRIVFTAPTNKAVAVLRRMVAKWNLGVECLTCAKLLGLKPKINHATGQQEFKKDYGKQSEAQNYDIIVVDEASMISASLWAYLIEESNLYTRILFVGDSAQLPPVNEPISQVFLQIENQSALTEIVRYRGAIAGLADGVRQNLYSGRLPPIETDYSSDGSEGVFCLDSKAWEENLIKAFKSEKYLENPDYCRALAYTNRRVASINKTVRSAVHGKDVPRFVIGERLIATEPYILPDPHGPSTVILANSGEVEVIDVIRSHSNGYKVWLLEALNFETGLNVMLPVLHEDEKPRFEREQRELTQRAKKGAGYLWEEFFENRQQFAWVDYCYAVTTHKSQGATFENCFVDVQNICTDKTVNKLGDKYVFERNQLLYVAFTRASHRLFVY